PRATCGALDRHELVAIKSTWHDAYAFGLHVVMHHQVVAVLRAFGHDSVSGARHALFDAETDIGKFVRAALVDAAHLAQRMEGDDVGNSQPAAQAFRDMPGHPEVRVHDVVMNVIAAHVGEHVEIEIVHVLEQALLADEFLGAGLDMDHPNAGAVLHDTRQIGVIPSREYVNLVAAFGEMAGDAVHVDILTTAVHPTEQRERRGMFADECNPPAAHARFFAGVSRDAVTPWNAASHSPVNRAISNFSRAAARAPCPSSRACAGSSSRHCIAAT